MARYKLSAAKVEKVVVPGRYGDGGGLYLQVSKGADPKAPPKSWLFRFMMQRKAYEMGLGSYDAFTLAEARDLALEKLRLVKRGINPIDERKAERAAILAATAKRMTFEDAAKQYIADNRPGWKSAIHAAQWESTLETYAFPIIGKLDVAAIETAHILKVLKQPLDGETLWTKRAETAKRLRGRIETVLSWATVCERRTGDNPARWHGHLKMMLPNLGAKGTSHPSMPYAVLPSFMDGLRARDGISARALEFTILTAARTGEVIGAKWGEFDLAAKVWTIPEGRMKAEKEHTVPLSARVVEILKALPREGDSADDFVFPGARKGKPLSNMAMLELLRGMSDGKGLTVHGFRSSFREWAGEISSHDPAVIEHALAHQLADKAQRAYQRGSLFPKRIRLMDDWARYCAKVPTVGNIVPIEQARA